MTAATAIKIYGVPFSVHTRKVIMACRLKQLPMEIVRVVPVDPATLPPDWDALSPTGLIPVMRDGDFLLPDSTAIALYLERKAPHAPLLPADPQAYGRVLALDAWAGSALFQSIGRPLFHNQVVKPALQGCPGDQSAIDLALHTAAPRAFAYLEQLLRSDMFLVAGQLSLADLAVVSNLLLLSYLGHSLDAARFPKLSRYLRAHVDSAAWRPTLAAELPLLQGMGLDTSILG